MNVGELGARVLLGASMHTRSSSGGGAIRPQETGASATYVVARVVTFLEDQVGWYLEVRVWIG